MIDSCRNYNNDVIHRAEFTFNLSIEFSSSKNLIDSGCRMKNKKLTQLHLYQINLAEHETAYKSMTIRSNGSKEEVYIACKYGEVLTSPAFTVMI